MLINKVTLGSMVSLLTTALYLPAYAHEQRSDYDINKNGLIEINSLADLDEIRNFPDGSALYGFNNGCPSEGCHGFELTTNLDFDTNRDGVMNEQDAYWNDGAGWQPIGNSSHFRAHFNGNDFVIRNLFINRPGYAPVGLFAYIEDATIENLGIDGPLTSVTGEYYVGLLGGLVTRIEQKSQFRRIYTNGKITGTSYIGGILGALYDGDIEQSYSLASFTNNNTKFFDNGMAGGLVGYGQFSTLVQTYAATQGLDQFAMASGLATSLALTTTIVAIDAQSSVWDASVSGFSGDENYFTSDGNTATDATVHPGSGYSTDALQCPQSPDATNCPSNPFEDWDGSVWDFGTANDYPVLIFNGIPTRDSDQDGVWDFYDAFPDNAAASIDADNDQQPDEWNPTCDSHCQATAFLTLDTNPASQTSHSHQDSETDALDSTNQAGTTTNVNSNLSISAGSLSGIIGCFGLLLLSNRFFRGRKNTKSPVSR